VLVAALRDLQWRRKRFAITVIGTALVFAMSLLMSGLATAFRTEINRTLNDQRAEYWVTNSGEAGPFSAGLDLNAADVNAIATTGGITAAAPVVFGRSTASSPDIAVVDVNILGVDASGLGAPTKASAGSPLPVAGSVVVPSRVGAKVGDTLEVGGVAFTVGGVVGKASLFAGSPSVFLTIADAQRVMVGGLPLLSMILVNGDPSAIDAKYAVFSRSQVANDLSRPLASAEQSINFVKVLLWMVAALIVGSVVYLTALERSRDIAVFKATGVSTAAIGAGICVQAVILALAACAIGGVVALMLAPVFPMDVVVSGQSLALLPVLAVVVGMIAGLFGVRRTASVTPAAAFGGP
jgi:putative ABC transport system permease protein